MTSRVPVEAPEPVRPTAELAMRWRVECATNAPWSRIRSSSSTSLARYRSTEKSGTHQTHLRSDPDDRTDVEELHATASCAQGRDGQIRASLGLRDLTTRVSALPMLGKRAEEELDQLESGGWADVLGEVVPAGPSTRRISDQSGLTGCRAVTSVERLVGEGQGLRPAPSRAPRRLAGPVRCTRPLRVGRPASVTHIRSGSTTPPRRTRPPPVSMSRADVARASRSASRREYPQGGTLLRGSTIEPREAPACDVR